MIRHIFLAVSALVICGMTIIVLVLPTDLDTQASSSQDLNENDVAKEIDANNTITNQGNSFLLTNVRIFDGINVVEQQDIRVSDGVIAQVAPSIKPSNDEFVILGEGMTAMPGLIDAHTHSFGSGLKDTLRFGVTTHLDMFTAEILLAAISADRTSTVFTDEADLFSAGTMATVTGGHGTQYGFPIDTIDQLTDIEAWVEKRKATGSDYIKLVYMPYQNRMPSIDRETAAEIIRQSHAKGLKAYAHISTQAAAKDMIEEGIDGLVHIFGDTLVESDLVSLAVNNQVVIIPTLAVIASVNNQGLNNVLAAREEVATYLSAQQKSTLLESFPANITGYDFAIAKQNVKRFFDAGVPILAGSDAPNSGTAYGASAHHEIFLLVESGLSPLQALRAGTSLPAEHFSLNGRGTIAVGNRADLILLEGNPAENIETTLNIKQVFKNGYAIARGLPTSSTGKTINASLLGDFETSKLLTIDGFMWSHSDDKIMNGKSVGSIKQYSLSSSNVPDSSAHDAPNSGSLLVTAEVNAGFPYPWAGAAVGDFIPPVEGIDLSAYENLEFRVKGTRGTYRVLVFDANASGIPPSQNFEITQDWQTVSLKLSEFVGFNKKAFAGFAFVAGPKLGSFEFMLDDVKLN